MGKHRFFHLAMLAILAATSWTEDSRAMVDSESIEEALRGHVRKLCVDIGERSPFHPGRLDRAKAYIRAVFEEAGLEVAEQPYEFQGVPVANLIARLPAAADAGAYYLIGAHYDTVPGTPGADDNASAVAVLLELAKRLAGRPPPVPLRLAAFTLEEPPAFRSGLQGSQVFVRSLRGSATRILGATILEMVGFTSPRQVYPLVLKWAGYPEAGNFIGIVGNWDSKPFGKAVLRGFQRNPALPVESLFLPFDGHILPATRLSDHASFWDDDWPAVMVTDTAFFRNPNYHLASDRPGTLDYGFMAELVRSLELSLEEMPPLR